MLFKVVLCVCVQALYFETAYVQCLPTSPYPGPPIDCGAPLPPGTPLACGALLPGVPFPPGAPLNLGPGTPLAPGFPLMPGAPLPCNTPFVEEFIRVPPTGPFYGRIIGGDIIVDTSAQYTPIGPAGVSIYSDDLYIGGNVLVTGKMPFLGTVLFEGTVPAAGTSAVAYECGDDNIGIIENIAPITGPVYDNLALLGGCNNIGLL